MNELLKDRKGELGIIIFEEQIKFLELLKKENKTIDDGIKIMKQGIMLLEKNVTTIK